MGNKTLRIKNLLCVVLKGAVVRPLVCMIACVLAALLALVAVPCVCDVSAVLPAYAADAEGDVVADSAVDATADAEGATTYAADAVADATDTDQSGLKENSFRYSNGTLIVADDASELLEGESADAGVSLLDDDASFVKWSLTPDGYINSYGNVIPNAIAKGIDVSKWNGQIDWERVKADGISFAIIRCGYGSDYTSQDDEWWEYNASECERLGIPYGVYLYSYALDTDMARSEAAHVLRLVEGHSPSLPIYLDLEDEGTTLASAQQSGNVVGHIASMAEAFCTTLQNAGYSVGVYANLNWWNNYLTDGIYENWDRWVAQYNYQCDYTGNYHYWQCTSNGSVDGVDGRVDLNFELRQSYPSDVDPDDWYVSEGALDYVQTRHLMGTYDGTNNFGPYDTITRGQVATILWRMAGSPSAGATSSFEDVNYDAYYGTAISWARSVGVISGYENADGTFTRFGPDDFVTREQLALMFANYARIVDGRSVDVSSTALDAMPDAASVSSWARAAVAWALDSGVLQGEESASGTSVINPQGNAWRASMAAMTQRYGKLG